MSISLTNQVANDSQLIEKLKFSRWIAGLSTIRMNAINKQVTRIAHEYFGKVVCHRQSFCDELWYVFVSLPGVHFNVIQKLSQLGFNKAERRITVCREHLRWEKSQMKLCARLRVLESHIYEISTVAFFSIFVEWLNKGG